MLLAEKGTDINNTKNSELIVAHSSFYFIGTMNPGGDFGKKELSPALRNRFTEIWCESCTKRTDLIDIIEHNIQKGVSLGNQEDGTSGIGKAIMNFIEWFKTTEVGKRFTISIRDVLTWVQFINRCVDKMDVGEAYLHGACLTFLDSLGSGVTATESASTLTKFQADCMEFFKKQFLNPSDLLLNKISVEKTENSFGIKPFYVEIAQNVVEKQSFFFTAPTTAYNALRILRGLQLSKAILLEGSPGVGKTSLVSALAKCTGNKLFRVNLSDQTDISDLFGADLPVEGGTGGQFAWRDGPLLQALKEGNWILLDELNLASQSVLEGLNACLDHRGEIFIPELGKTFLVRPGTKFFACQNPLKQGGSRRGLPQSFLNRFTQVYINALNSNDLHCILSSEFVELPQTIVSKMIEFNKRITSELEQHKFGYKGAPWEFNLRDMVRWCEVLMYQYKKENEFKPESLVGLIYSNRMRTFEDKEYVKSVFQEIFKTEITGDTPVPYVTEENIFVGDVSLQREITGCNVNVLRQEPTSLMLRSQFGVLRSLMYNIELNWMSILVSFIYVKISFKFEIGHKFIFI